MTVLLEFLANRFLTNQFLAQWPEAIIKAKKLRQKISDLENQETLLNDSRASIPLEVMLKYHENEKQRQKVIEDKAKTNLLGITLAFSVIFAGFGFLTNQATQAIFTGHWQVVCLIPILLGVTYLIFGGIAALSALEIGRVYDFDLNDEITFSNEKEKVGRLLLCLELNQLRTMLRSNWTYTSNKCIRNGTISLATFVYLVAFLLYCDC